MLALLAAFSAYSAPSAPPNMNDGSVPYAISNPPGSTADWTGTPGTYSTQYTANVAGPVEHFDVYGRVETRYSEVYWTRNAPIPLPPALVERFANGVMAITGYEIDQVTHADAPDRPPADGPLGGFACYPSCDEGNDRSVPIYSAYNHHYFSWLVGDGAEAVDAPEPTSAKAPNPTRTRIVERAAAEGGYPTSIVFQENPGGEYRKSYHGYPSGYAQLIASPKEARGMRRPPTPQTPPTPADVRRACRSG